MAGRATDRMEVCANMRGREGKKLLGTNPALKFASSCAGLFIPSHTAPARPPDTTPRRDEGLTFFVNFYYVPANSRRAFEFKPKLILFRR